MFKVQEENAQKNMCIPYESTHNEKHSVENDLI